MRKVYISLQWLSLLGGFEQAANLRGKKSNDNRKAWNKVNSQAGAECGFAQNKSASIASSWEEDKHGSINIVVARVGLNLAKQDYLTWFLNYAGWSR